MASKTKSRATAKKVTKKVATRAAPTTPSADSATLVQVLREDGSFDARHDPKLPAERLRYLYRTMVQVREFDRRMLVLQRQGRIGFYGPILGQEAATVASIAALETQDWIFPALREGAAAMMRGLPMVEALAQLIGNAKDRCKGRQMPCHYTLREGRYVSMSSVIGTQITHAVGCAMALKIRKENAIALGFMGDGATSSNDFHSGMNFAAVTKAPCVLFCQNNQWAISVPIAQQSASETIAIKARAYGMPSVRVDGNDAVAVYAVTRAAAERARKGLGPTFIEALTYRRLGHSSSDDPTRYRDEREVKVWEKRDPVDRMRRALQKKGLWSQADEQDLQDTITKEVSAAVAEAETFGEPAAETLITDVFAEIPAQLREQFRDLAE